MCSHMSFEDVQNICKEYQNDEKYMYKVCNNGKYSLRNWIVVMKKCSHTITNEDRKDIVDKNHAKFRANKLMVVKIFNVNSGTCVEYVVNVYMYSKPLRYEVGRVVECDKFDNNIDNVCSGGIHYFKTLITAYYYCCNQICKCDGKWMEWYDNGGKKTEINYKNRVLEGMHTTWHMNGTINIQGNYKNGFKDGLWTTLCWDGCKYHENYKLGILDGLFTKWYDNGQKWTEGNFKNGEMYGLLTVWYMNGQKCTETNYDDNGMDVAKTGWSRDGKLIIGKN